MKTILLAAMLGLALPLPRLLAASAPVEKWSFPLEPVKTVPAEVRSQMPSGAKTLQCGLGPTGEKGERVLLHLYSLAKLPAQDSLDVYKHLENRWRRVNRVVVTDSYHGPSHVGLGMNSYPEEGMTWLNRRRRSALIVPLLMHSDPVDQVWLLTFSSGYAKPPVIQKFPHIESAGTYSYGTDDTSLHTVDERGLTQITQVHEDVYGPEVTRYTDTYSWNGRRFVKQASK